MEIGEACEERLNLAADALALRQWEWESRQEEKKHGHTWLIDAAMAQGLDDAVENGLDEKSSSEEDEEEAQQSPKKRLRLDESSCARALAEHHELRQAATLLQTSNWVRLSAGIFMNAGGERWDENWRSIATQEEAPSMMRTVFTDFHRLAVTITRRLVQTSIFQAMARLRASDVWHFSKRKRRLDVTANDVTAALLIINMNEDAQDFWIWTARRCGIMVTGSTENDELSYEHVEAFLSDFTVPQLSEDAEAADLSSLSEEDNDEGDAKLAALERQHEEYTEELDQRAREAEEADLLRALGEQVAAPLSSEMSMSRPPMLRTAKGDQVDWRDWTDYGAPWEMQRAQV